jgi:excinuclease ABC subunit C
MLKDDKSYPSFRLTVQERFPRLELTRRIVRDGSLYFGPFPDAGAARASAAFLQRAFPLRRCRGAAPGGRTRKGRACLDFQMGRCLGPCVGDENEAAYRRAVEEVAVFLKGKGRELLRDLTESMKAASAALDFEGAALLRDRIAALSTVVEGQRMVGDPGEDADVIGACAAGDTTMVSCLFIRSGLVVGKRDATFTSPGPASGGAEDGTGTAEAIDAFLSRHYHEKDDIPPRLLLPRGVSFLQPWRETLSGRAGRRVEVVQPMRGKGRRLLALAEANAREGLRQALARRESAAGAAAEAARVLHLPEPPLRIACVDVSHTAGRQPYASVVAWREGRLDKGEYRLFALRETDPGDDFAGLAEAIRRRLTGSVSQTLDPPDLLVVDGGKGQLGRVVRLLGEIGGEEVRAVSLSKGRSERRASPGTGDADEIWLAGRANPLRLPRHSPVLRLLQLLRDEAHRFALTAHRRRRGKSGLASALDGIPGVGTARRKALLTHFGSVAAIAAASIEEIDVLPGIDRGLAGRIHQALNPSPESH